MSDKPTLKENDVVIAKCDLETSDHKKIPAGTIGYVARYDEDYSHGFWTIGIDIEFQGGLMFHENGDFIDDYVRVLVYER